MKDLDTKPTAFQNIQVIAIPEVDTVTGKTKYHTTFSPASPIITQPDTVVNYQLVSPTPEGVVFNNVNIKQHTDQLSTPSIGLSGKVVTFSDENTVQETISLTFYFSDKDGVKFDVDPDLVNEPEPH